MLLRFSFWGLALVAALALAPARAGEGSGAPGPQGFRWAMPAWTPAPPVPEDNPMTAAKVELGRRLFYDARLSADGTTACASCHLQALAFTDGRATAEGVRGAAGHRNAPSLANVGYFPTLTWANPHLDRLEIQALVPLFGTEPEEMGLAGREDAVFARLAADPWYARAFPAAFPERSAPDLATVTRALAAFQRSLISVGSAYDRAKRGGAPEAMSPAARRGEALFFDHRLECYHCHGGLHFTDNRQTARSRFPESAYHNTGLYNLDGTGAYPAFGKGLAEFTGRPEDMGRFRTPSLRNVAVTAPYMHDGSVATLAEAIGDYAAGGRTIPTGAHAGVGAASPRKSGLLRGFTLSAAEKADLIAFLESLTDEGFLADPAFADPWPKDHPARADRRPAAAPEAPTQPKEHRP